MTSSPIKHYFILPFLASLLLFTLSLLPQLNYLTSIPSHIIQPLYTPLRQLNHSLHSQQQFLSDLPQIRYQNLLLRQENSQLQSQLLLLKNQLHYDSLPSLDWPSQPVKIVNLSPLVTATATDLSLIKPGQPLVDSTSLLGLVTEVKPPLIYILPLTHQDIQLQVQTLDHIQADYSYTNQIPQITGIPSQTPIPLDTIIYTLPTTDIPEGLVVGTTKQTLSNPQQPLQTISVDLSGHINQVNNPRIITSP